MAASDYSELVACTPAGLLVPKVSSRIAADIGFTADTGLQDLSVWASGWSATSVERWQPLQVQMKMGLVVVLGGGVRKTSGWLDAEPVGKVPEAFNPNRQVKSSTVEVTPDGYVRIVGSNSGAGVIGIYAMWMKQ